MSPEIILGEEFDLPTDVFSLGVILCEILARTLADDVTFKVGSLLRLKLLRRTLKLHTAHPPIVRHRQERGPAIGLSWCPCRFHPARH